MSKRHDVQIRLRSMGDIAGILSAMKNLALMEIHKLARFLAMQSKVVEGIEAAASDFFSFYPEMLPHPDRARRVYLAIGSDRGFCGDFNETVLAALDRHRETEPAPDAALISVGHKLSTKLGPARRAAATLSGPSVTEEIPPVLITVMETLRDLQREQRSGSALDLVVLAHGSNGDGYGIQPRRPFLHISGRRGGTTVRPSPPVLNLDPVVFVTRLMDQYLFAALHQIAYSSLMAENRQRFQHMDQALQRMERETAELTRKHQVLRQEEITQEIAVIMLSAEAIWSGR